MAAMVLEILLLIWVQAIDLPVIYNLMVALQESLITVADGNITPQVRQAIEMRVPVLCQETTPTEIIKSIHDQVLLQDHPTIRVT